MPTISEKIQRARDYIIGLIREVMKYKDKIPSDIELDFYTVIQELMNTVDHLEGAYQEMGVIESILEGEENEG